MGKSRRRKLQQRSAHAGALVMPGGNPAERRKRILTDMEVDRFFLDNPEASIPQAAEQLGLSKSYIQLALSRTEALMEREAVKTREKRIKAIAATYDFMERHILQEIDRIREVGEEVDFTIEGLAKDVVADSFEKLRSGLATAVANGDPAGAMLGKTSIRRRAVRVLEYNGLMELLRKIQADRRDLYGLDEPKKTVLTIEAAGALGTRMAELIGEFVPEDRRPEMLARVQGEIASKFREANPN